MTAVATFMAFTSYNIFFFVWLVFGYAGVIFIPLSLLKINSVVLLIVDKDYLILKGAGLPLQKDIRIHKDNIEAITLGHYGPQNDTESIVSLNLLLKKSTWWKKRIMLAPFDHPKEKVQIFNEIVLFLENQGFNFRKDNSYK